MKRCQWIHLYLMSIILFSLSNLDAKGEFQIQKIFLGVTQIELNTLNGNCIINTEPSNEVKIRFVFPHSHTNLEPQFIQLGETLTLKENLHLAQNTAANWYLTVPEETEITFISFSGNLTVTGIKSNNIKCTTISGTIVAKDCSGNLDFKTISGNLDMESITGSILLQDVTGKITMHTMKGLLHVKSETGDVEGINLEGNTIIKSLTGNIEFSDSSGTFDIKTASGDIEAQNLLTQKASVFKTASGDILVTLKKSLTNDITLESTSGDVELNYNGNPIAGTLEFQVAAESGEINAPFIFEKEEECHRWGKKYLIKATKIETNHPHIILRTSSATASLKKK